MLQPVAERSAGAFYEQTWGSPILRISTMNKHTCTVALAAAAVLAILPGCTSYADKKQAARMKWDKVSAQARVTVARDLFESGRYEDARITAQQCLQSDPELPPTWQTHPHSIADDQ